MAASPRAFTRAALRLQQAPLRTFSTARASLLSYSSSSSTLRQQRQKQNHPSRRSPTSIRTTTAPFHTTSSLQVVKPFLLADIGEGITECQLIQWFVQPGARVEQFDKICEVQSDKASVEITSPFDGVIKKLYYEPDDMAITGKPLVDIDIQGEISPADEAKLAGGAEEGKEQEEGSTAGEQEEGSVEGQEGGDGEGRTESNAEPAERGPSQPSRPAKGGMGSLATPAVRRMIKEHDLDIEDIEGSGKDGRVMKEDVQRFISSGGAQPSTTTTTPQHAAPVASKEDRRVPLTPVQNMMYKTMTKSLNIPHFLYSTTADLTAVTTLRKRLNATTHTSPEQKLTHLPFIIKAVSLALQHHPILNAALNTQDPKKPELTHKGAHNFGVAMDAPAGLLVPVIRDVQGLSISEIAAALRGLSQKARENKLAPGDFSGATFTVSNIGSVGGGVVAPVISEPQVAILGVGRSKIVPAFDEEGGLVRREELVLSWSADHRVIDGAECARCAERVRGYLEEPGAMLASMR